MNDIEEAVRKAVTVSVSVDDRIKEVLVKHLQLEPKDENSPIPGRMAYGYQAIDVAIRLANMFLSIKNPGDHRNFRALCDLTFELNNNDFWIKNASFLTPILHVCLNTYRDGITLLVERESRGEYSSNDTLIAASRAAPLEIFPIIAYLFDGPQLMATCSLALKRELAPYFLG